MALGCVDFTENKAKNEKTDYVVGVAEAVNRRPSVLEGAKVIKLKILVSRFSREIIGAQVARSNISFTHNSSFCDNA